MSPSAARMAEVVETTEMADSVEQVVERPQVAEVIETGGSNEPALIRNLLQRVEALTGANRRIPPSSTTSPVRGNELQVVLDQVATQHDRGPPEQDGERCGVCAGSFGERPRARCAGCSKRIHKIGCVTYMTVTTKLQAGMCNLCCNRVNRWMDEVREYSSNTGQLWREDDWLKRLVKSHSEGLALSHHAYRPFNELQNFLWKTLGQGLLIR